MDEDILESLGSPLRDLQKKFGLLIEPHRPALWRYCRMVTGSPWDAEDLVQETLMRAYATLPKLWQPVIPKAFLFRIATNIWLNQCRGARHVLDYSFEEHDLREFDQDPFEVREAIETLVRFLPPRQMVVVLLCEVFDFKAHETADMVGTTEGAIKALLHRARKKLYTLNPRIDYNEPVKLPPFDKTQAALVEAFLEAFNRRDPDAIARLMDNHVVNDIVHISEEQGKEIVRKHSLEGWAKDPMPMYAYLKVIWNKPIVVVMAKTETGEALYNLIGLEIEEGTIIKEKNYYFCQDLLMTVAKELNVAVHLNGYMYED
ncbi:MAG: sigma-70 family RNA polymerase sigma factor [Bacillota bacterium]